MDDYIVSNDGRTPSENQGTVGKFLDNATRLINLGYPVHPLSAPDVDGSCRYRTDLREQNIGKAPLSPHGHRDATTDPAQIVRWAERWPHANVGINLELAGVVDLSSDSAEWLDRFREWGIPDGALVYTSSADYKRHQIMRLPEGAPATRICVSGQYDIMSAGSAVGPGSTHRSGRTYTPIGDIPPLDDLPYAPDWVVAMLREAAEKRTQSREVPPEETGINRPPPVRLDERATRIWRGESPALGDDSEPDRSKSLYKIGRALAQAGAAPHVIAEALAERDETLGYDKYTDRRDAAGRYRELAQKALAAIATFTYQSGELADPVSVAEKFPPLPRETILNSLWQNEYGDALLLRELYRDRVLYDPATRQWAVWTGHHWRDDSNGLIKRLIAGQLAHQYLSLAAEFAREAEAASKDEATNLLGMKRQLIERASGLRGLRRAKNVLEFATTIFGPEDPDWCWDRDPWKLGVANGTLDLREGVIGPGDPRDYIRTVSPIEWRGLDKPAERWERFLVEVFNGDTTLIEFLQRLLGYGMTGLTTEHVVVLLYGPGGRNGKDTLIEAVHHVLGTYAKPVSKAVLLRRRESLGAAEPHIMDLQSRRLVWTSETQESDHLDAAQVKYLTGGGTITSRQLYGSMVEFQPTHLTLLLTNYTPHADPDDMALWSRVLLIPFNQRFVDAPQHPNEHLRDSRLKETLREEASGILAWLIRGCLSWQREGLNPPDSVKLATEQYREAEDEVNLFIEERCILESDTSVGATQLYETYRSWAMDQGQKPMTNTKFGRKLGTRRGISKGRGPDTRIWYYGIRLQETNSYWRFGPNSLGGSGGPAPTNPSTEQTETDAASNHSTTQARDNLSAISPSVNGMDEEEDNEQLSSLESTTKSFSIAPTGCMEAFVSSSNCSTIQTTQDNNQSSKETLVKEIDEPKRYPWMDDDDDIGAIAEISPIPREHWER